MQKEHIMQEKRILIITKDKRKFLTYEKNLPSIIEFAQTFDAEVKLVSVDKKTKSFELKNLTIALCDSNYNEKFEYKIIKDIFPKKNNKNKKEKISKNLQEFMKNKLLKGNTLSLSQLKEKYKKYDIADGSISSYMTKVKKEFLNQGLKIEKISAGNYRLIR